MWFFVLVCFTQFPDELAPSDLFFPHSLHWATCIPFLFVLRSSTTYRELKTSSITLFKQCNNGGYNHTSTNNLWHALSSSEKFCLQNLKRGYIHMNNMVIRIQISLHKGGFHGHKSIYTKEWNSQQQSYAQHCAKPDIGANTALSIIYASQMLPIQLHVRNHGQEVVQSGINLVQFKLILCSDWLTCNMITQETTCWTELIFLSLMEKHRQTDHSN